MTSESFETAARAAHLSSFDGQTQIQCKRVQPSNTKELMGIVGAFKGALSPKGQGLSYAMACARDGGCAIDMRSFDRVLEFREEALEVRVEAGITLGKMLAFLLPQGFYFPVLPGHPMITVGGGIGFNVHSKSQFQSGLFGDWVKEMLLFHPDHGLLTLNRQSNPDIFDLTLGGFGLTGVVIEVTLGVQRLKGQRVQQQVIGVDSFREARDVMLSFEHTSDQVYSWHDLSSSKTSGRGVVFVDRFVPGAMPHSTPEFDPVHYAGKIDAKLGHRLPWAAAGAVLPFFVTPVYGLMTKCSRQVKEFGVFEAAFPLNGKEVYFKGFGKKGFCEYQLLVPHDAWESFSKDLEGILKNNTLPITLASLKIFRGEQRELNFVGDGVCLALDIPNWPKSIEMMTALDGLVLRYGGIANLAKDSRISSEVVMSMYPEYSLFRQRIRGFDPKMRFSSELRARLKL